jgi:cell fate (sporulation/competence/biofilm development) regulator YmcA (YheA/YmcA/DUF963 family)
MYLVQSVLFDKSKFSLHLSKEWLKHHHYKHLDVDEKTNAWRFRQVSPNEAKKQGYTNFKTKKLGKSGVSLVLAYNQEKSGGGSGASVSKTQEKFDNCLEILNEIYERNLGFNNRLEVVIVDNVTEALRLLNDIPTDENIYKLFEVIKGLLGLYDSPTSSNLVRHLVNVYNKIVSNYPNYFKLTKPIRVDDFIKPEKADIIPLKDPNTIPIAIDLPIRHFTQEQEMTDYLDELIIRLEGSINHFSQIRFNPDDIPLVQDYYNTQEELNALMNRFREVFDFLQNQPLKLQKRLATKYIKFFNRFLKKRTDLEKIFRKADALRIHLEKNVINVRSVDDENLARERDQMEDEDKYKRPSGSGRGRELCISCD